VPVQIEPLLPLLLFPKRLALILHSLTKRDDLLPPFASQAGIDDLPLEKPERIDEIRKHQHLNIVVL
jgi:hypothetical protein